MTVVTIGAGVHIPVDIGVMEIGGVVVAVAARARELRIVAAHCMACNANTAGVAMTRRKLRVIRVWKCAARPIGRGVASRAT